MHRLSTVLSVDDNDNPTPAAHDSEKTLPVRCMRTQSLDKEGRFGDEERGRAWPAEARSTGLAMSEPSAITEASRPAMSEPSAITEGESARHERAFGNY
jgi:hypothetical protein